MSENREVIEKKEIDEAEKIDIMNLVADLLNAVRKLWGLLIVLLIACTLRSYFATSFSYTPQYVASATVSVTTPGGGYTNVKSAQEMAEIFPYILTSGVLKDVVAQDMGLDYLPGQITVEAEEGMNMLTISVSGDDPQMAYNILQSVIENYPQVAEYIFGETSLQILDETGIPSDTRREVVIRGSWRRGLIQGAVLDAVIICLYAFAKRTVRSRDKLNKQINLRDLGSLPYIRQKKRRKTSYNNINIMNERTLPSYAEAIRRLRIRVLREMDLKEKKVLMVTSSVPGEGKSTVSVNLAVELARQGKKVILVDCDLRNPSVAEIMQDTEEHPGLGSVLRGETPISDALAKIDIPEGELQVLYGGNPNSQDASLLGSEEMGAFVKIIRDMADYVILDTAPAELLVDASLMAKYTDAALYVIRYDYTKMNKIRGGIEALALRKVDIIGYIFNGDMSRKENRYGYGYSGYGGYGRYGRYGHYGHYGRYGKLKDTGRREDLSGRVIKD